MTRTIAIANQKGGVGKTTTAINLGAALAKMGKKTLLVDLDPQGALSAGMGQDAHMLEETIYNALMDFEYPVARILLPIDPNLDLIPANIDLAAAEVELIAELRREFALRRLLEPLHPWYDFVLIDCPPSLGLLTTNALCAASEIVIPMQCEYFSMRAIRTLLQTIQRIQARLNPGLELTGILPTMYTSGTIHAKEVVDEIRAVFGERVFEVVIHKTIRFAEASVASQAILDYARSHRGAAEYTQMAEELVNVKTPANEPP